MVCLVNKGLVWWKCVTFDIFGKLSSVKESELVKFSYMQVGK